MRLAAKHAVVSLALTLLTTRRREAVAVARGDAKGTVFTLANPEAASAFSMTCFPRRARRARTRRRPCATT